MELHSTVDIELYRKSERYREIYKQIVESHQRDPDDLLQLYRHNFNFHRKAIFSDPTPEFKIARSLYVLRRGGRISLLLKRDGRGLSTQFIRKLYRIIPNPYNFENELYLKLDSSRRVFLFGTYLNFVSMSEESGLDLLYLFERDFTFQNRRGFVL